MSRGPGVNERGKNRSDDSLSSPLSSPPDSVQPSPQKANKRENCHSPAAKDNDSRRGVPHAWQVGGDVRGAGQQGLSARLARQTRQTRSKIPRIDDDDFETAALASQDADKVMYVENANMGKKRNPLPVPQSKAAMKRKAKLEARKWEAPFVFTDPRSPLAHEKAGVRDMLLLPGAWDVLTPEEQDEILALFPDETHIIEDDTAPTNGVSGANKHGPASVSLRPRRRPNLVSLRNDDNFRHDCSRYSENMKQGRHEDEWLHQAWVAHQQRRRGDFDDIVASKLQRDWGVDKATVLQMMAKQKNEKKPTTGKRKMAHESNSEDELAGDLDCLRSPKRPRSESARATAAATDGDGDKNHAGLAQRGEHGPEALADEEEDEVNGSANGSGDDFGGATDTGSKLDHAKATKGTQPAKEMAVHPPPGTPKAATKPRCSSRPPSGPATLNKNVAASMKI